MKGGWVLDADVSSFFDMLDHEQLRDLLCRRVVDGVVVRLIHKWLNAGVMQEDRVSRSDRGTPQRGCDLTPPGEHLPSRSPRQQVGRCGSASSVGSGLSRLLCG